MRSLSFLFVLTAFNFSQAATKIITTCSGFVSPDNMAVSIKLISDPENDGSTTKAEVHTYLDGQYLGPLECEGNTPMTSPIACHTKYG